jgi:hypothetical protein
MEMETPQCQSTIYLDGHPVRCDLDVAHNGFHCCTEEDVDCSPDGDEGEYKRPGADAMILWMEKR